jgi:hypothetical protein
MSTYKLLDPAENVGIPQPQPYAGLYAPNVPHIKTTWSKDYRKYVPPDAVAYSSQYFELAKGHIPTSVRVGNNTIVNSPFKFKSDTYNSLCYS